MLVLSRKKNESIRINDDVTVVVVEIRGDKVRLGVEAPKEVPVHRDEVYQAIRREGGQAVAKATVSTAELVAALRGLMQTSMRYCRTIGLPCGECETCKEHNEAIVAADALLSKVSP